VHTVLYVYLMVCIWACR